MDAPPPPPPPPLTGDGATSAAPLEPGMLPPKFGSSAKLFVGNMGETEESAVRSRFGEFGEVGEVFIGKGFVFVSMDYRFNAEYAKALPTLLWLYTLKSSGVAGDAAGSAAGWR